MTRDIRTEEAGNDASKVAALPAVRAALLERQRRFAVPPGLVADGRDMGTVVFPLAQVKIFLTASPAERAHRRHKQLKEKGVTATLAALSLEIAERDRRDITRSASPLVASADAVLARYDGYVRRCSGRTRLGCCPRASVAGSLVGLGRGGQGTIAVVFGNPSCTRDSCQGSVYREHMTESFAELFEQSIASQRIRPGTILNGLIVEVGQDYVIVNVGLKSEAVIPSDQFKNEKGEIEVAVGETVEVALDSVEDGSGETRLSREKAKRARTWTRLETAFEKQEVVIGIITGRVKGGFHRRDRQCARLLAGLSGRCAPGARSVLP